MPRPGVEGRTSVLAAESLSLWTAGTSLLYGSQFSLYCIALISALIQWDRFLGPQTSFPLLNSGDGANPSVRSLFSLSFLRKIKSDCSGLILLSSGVDIWGQ